MSVCLSVCLYLREVHYGVNCALFRFEKLKQNRGCQGNLRVLKDGMRHTINPRLHLKPPLRMRFFRIKTNRVLLPNLNTLWG
jgi:hypothetical protein